MRFSKGADPEKCTVGITHAIYFLITR
jgi:hypothetical protein